MRHKSKEHIVLNNDNLFTGALPVDISKNVLDLFPLEYQLFGEHEINLEAYDMLRGTLSSSYR
jgi:hypothetical protein